MRGNHIEADLSQQVMAFAALRLEAWLETMRGPGGYGGPVVHWWRDNLLYTGPGLDWRYEGIILGYLKLFRNTGDDRWLDKARRAGIDLLQGQLPSGNFRHSCFEANPGTGGTPHEAACDLALLRLAHVLREREDPLWETVAEAARRNLWGYILAVLWDDEARTFRNLPNDPTFVPNKAATIVEALLAWAELTGEKEVVNRYVGPSLDAIVKAQVRAPNSPLDGAIEQGIMGARASGRYFPFYIARIIPALLLGYEATGREVYQDAALRAMAFILRFRLPDGSLPQVVYRNGRMNRHPQWVAGAGDILRAMKWARRCGMDVNPEPTQLWLLRGLQLHGGIATAHGFGGMEGRRPSVCPDARDLLPVCGWADKAFRYLAGMVHGGNHLPAVQSPPEVEMDCIFRGERCLYRETATVLEIRGESGWRYQWTKGTPWAKLILCSERKRGVPCR
ncbi:MAG: hypothetical protein H5T61_08570 [Thermoflexales bacterium]|nr:hypothetical protein [Thermoflexales bacterium]